MFVGDRISSLRSGTRRLLAALVLFVAIPASAPGALAVTVPTSAALIERPDRVAAEDLDVVPDGGTTSTPLPPAALRRLALAEDDAHVDIRYSPDSGRAPPQIASYTCDASSNLLDPAGDVGRVSRAFAGLEVRTTAPSSSGQRIFRAVEPDELADLMGSGQYRNIAGIGDGKYFFPTRQQADAFAEMMTKRGMGGPYCTTSGCMPSNLLRQVERISPAGEGAAYYIPESMLPYIDDIIIHGG